MNKTRPMREELGMKKERFIQITVAVLVVAIALLIWGMVDRAEADTRTATLKADTHSATVVYFGDGDSERVTYEVTSEDGELTILMNDEPMPEDRILRKGKTLILLDDEGRAVFQALIGDDGEIEDSQSLGGSLHAPRVPRGVRPVRVPRVTRTPRSSGLHVGISAGRVDNALATQLGLEEGSGILVNRVFKDSPAANAGMETHDIITEIDGEAVSSLSALRSRLREMEEGETMTLTVLRSGQSKKLEITPEPRTGERVVYFESELGPGEPPAPPRVYSFSDDGDWSIAVDELSEFPGSVGFFGDDDGIAVLAPGADYDRLADLQKSAAKEREAELKALEERLARLEEMLQELLEQQRR